MKPTQTIIIITYNTPTSYFQKCLESVLQQTYKQIEIIVVDDGSTIELKKTIEKYQDSRIKLIRQKNQGESVARNVGIKEAKTNNIIFVDSDDYVEKEMCQKIHDYLQKNSNYDILIYNCYVDFTNKTIKNKFYLKTGLLNNEDIEQIQLQNIEKGIVKYYPPKTNISVVWAKVYNKEFILKNNLKFIPNIIRMPDALFNTEAFEKANVIYNMDEYLYHYQQNEFSICNRYSKKTVEFYEIYINLMKQYIKKYNKNGKFTDTLNLKIVTSIDIYMENYFFNKANTNSKKEIDDEFRNLLQKYIYVEAFENVKKEYLSLYQKMILQNAKNGNIKNLRILRKIKNILKKL